MNRREFLKLFAKAAVVAAVPSLVKASGPGGFIGVDLAKPGEDKSVYRIISSPTGGNKFIESNQYGNVFTVSGGITKQERITLIKEIEADMMRIIPETHRHQVTYPNGIFGPTPADPFDEPQTIAWKYTPRR